MRNIIIGLMLFFSLFVISQGRAEEEVLVEYYTISIGESFAFDGYEIKFVDVLSDNRCPKAVMCVVAGEANVVLELYKGNVKVSSNNLRFTPTIYLPHSKGNIYNSEFVKVTGVELFPHPISDNDMPKSDYKLKLLFEEILQ